MLFLNYLHCWQLFSPWNLSYLKKNWVTWIIDDHHGNQHVNKNEVFNACVMRNREKREQMYRTSLPFNSSRCVGLKHSTFLEQCLLLILRPRYCPCNTIYYNTMRVHILKLFIASRKRNKKFNELKWKDVILFVRLAQSPLVVPRYWWHPVHYLISVGSHIETLAYAVVNEIFIKAVYLDSWSMRL